MILVILLKKTDYNTKIAEIEGKIPDVSVLAKKTALNTVENKIPNVTNLATKTALTAIENKIPDASSLVKKMDYKTRVAEIDIKVSSLDGKINENKTKSESIGIKLIGSIKNILSIFWGNIAFDGEDGSQAYLIFQTIHKHVNIVTNTKYISEWKSNGLSDESIKPPPTSDKSLAPLINYYSYNIRVKLNGSILRQPKVSNTHEKTVNIYIVYELAGSSFHFDDPTLKNCLFGAVTLFKNVDIDEYGYSGNGTGFDRRSSFSFPGGGFRQSVLIFGADMSSSDHIEKKTYYFLEKDQHKV